MIGLRSRNRSELPERLEALGKAVELADGRLTPESIDDARRLTEKAGERLRHGTANTLVALVGATGSGKSSVTNLLVGSEVATAGVRRPTTSSTLACIFGDDDVDPLLDWMEVDNRHRVEAEAGPLDGMVLLDVPDFDSIALAHRMEMERIADLADLLVWITDPEKYADLAMHNYLAELAGHGAVMTVVLNKTDLMTPEETKACRDDMARLLGRAGLEEAPVLALSALTGHGKDPLEALLADSISSKKAAVDRLAADTDQAARALLDQLGELNGPSEVPKKVADSLRDDLLAVSGIDTVTKAVSAGYRRDAAKKAGWPFTRWAKKLRPHPLRRLHLGRNSAGKTSLPEPSGIQRARIGGAIRSASDSVTAELPYPWPEHVLAAGSPDEAVLADRIDQGVADVVRSHTSDEPSWWSLADVLQTIVALITLGGGIWLGLIALVAYLRIPELPTPNMPAPLDAFPVPTTMLIGGLIVGLLLTLLFRQVARVGGARRAHTVRKRAGEAIAEVSQDLVVEPINAELARHRGLHELLEQATVPA